MAEDSAQERTEAPTPKRRDDSRKEGMVAMSREVSSAALLGTFVLYFVVLGHAGLQEMARLWRYAFQNLYQPDLTIPMLWRGVADQAWALGIVLLALFLAAFLVGLLATTLQVGFVLNPLRFQGNRINPLEGLKRIFSLNGLAELMKSLFKMGVIGYITYLSLAEEAVDMLSLSRLPLTGIFEFNFNLLVTLFSRVAIALVILAIFDYLFQRWNFEQRIKMTKQELKDELKQTEGDPQLRSRVRQIQREMSRARMMQNVPKADVVVTNPTHYAVALWYDREVMHAPRVVAKGVDFVAERIRQIARENEVTIVENPTVAREIYAQVEIGQEVPEHFFRAVAEILAYVYRIKGRSVPPSSAG